MSNLHRQHPYVDSLIKRIITIIVTWNVVTICLVGSLLVVGFIGLVFAGVGASTGSSESYVIKPLYGSGSNEILSIPIKGTILGTNESGSDSLSSLFGQAGTFGYDIKDQLYAAADQDAVSAVILEIDSPGGTIYGARAIADGVAYYKEKTKKPVYAHVEGMGASGAYWAAASTDKIISDYGSDTGSIGVIMGPFEYYNKPLSQDGGLLGGGIVTQNGIESTNITAGTSKDVGNPYRKLTDTEVAQLQKQVNNEYDNFVSFVSEHRKIPGETIRDSIGAMSYDPKSALELKLIDSIGSRQAAYDSLAEAAGVKGDYYVAREERSPTGIGALLQAFGQRPQSEVSKVNLCSLAQTALAYHGDVSKWCDK